MCLRALSFLNLLRFATEMQDLIMLKVWDLWCRFIHGPHEYTLLSDEISRNFATVRFSDEKNLTWGTLSYPLLKNYQIRKYGRVCNNLIINFCSLLVSYMIYKVALKILSVIWEIIFLYPVLVVIFYSRWVVVGTHRNSEGPWRCSSYP